MHVAIRCDESPEIRAVVLTGAGKAFSAGGDLKLFAGYGDQLSTILKEMTVYCHAAASRLIRMDKPLITAVNGAAAGMGMSFAIAGLAAPGIEIADKKCVDKSFPEFWEELKKI